MQQGFGDRNRREVMWEGKRTASHTQQPENRRDNKGREQAGEHTTSKQNNGNKGKEREGKGEITRNRALASKSVGAQN